MTTTPSDTILKIIRARNHASRLLLLAVVLAMPGLAGCSGPGAGLLSDTASREVELDAAYGILYELLDDEAQVDGILLVKSASPQVEKLLREIATASSRMRDQLKEFIERDPALSGTVTGLPQAEAKARSSISAATAGTLLTSRDERFQVLILMTQEKAMSYGQHLARAIADQDQNRERADALNQMSISMKSFHDRARDLILSNCTAEALAD